DSAGSQARRRARPQRVLHASGQAPNYTRKHLRSIRPEVFSPVELRGFEPLTPTLPVWCATNCAIAPWCGFKDTPPEHNPPNRWRWGPRKRPPRCAYLVLHHVLNPGLRHPVLASLNLELLVIHQDDRRGHLANLLLQDLRVGLANLNALILQLAVLDLLDQRLVQVICRSGLRQVLVIPGSCDGLLLEHGVVVEVPECLDVAGLSDGVCHRSTTGRRTTTAVIQEVQEIKTNLELAIGDGLLDVLMVCFHQVGTVRTGEVLVNVG